MSSENKTIKERLDLLDTGIYDGSPNVRTAAGWTVISNHANTGYKVAFVELDKPIVSTKISKDGSMFGAYFYTETFNENIPADIFTQFPLVDIKLIHIGSGEFNGLITTHYKSLPSTVNTGEYTFSYNDLTKADKYPETLHAIIVATGF